MCPRGRDRHDVRMTTTPPAGPAAPADPPLPAAGAAVVALAAAALLVHGRAVLPLALAAGAGLVVLCTGQPSNVGWFGVCLLAGWCALVAPRVQAVLFWALALVVFGVEQLVAVGDAGWASWSIGTTFMTFAV